MTSGVNISGYLKSKHSVITHFQTFSLILTFFCKKLEFNLCHHKLFDLTAVQPQLQLTNMNFCKSL